MTFLRMLMLKIDPFAIYAAERELARHEVHVSRDQLVSHYLVRGQLRTLVQKLTQSGPKLAPDEAMATAIMEGPDESKNPRFVAPLLTALVLSMAVLTAVCVSMVIFHWQILLNLRQIDLFWPAIIAASLVALCILYAFLGAAIGRTKANKLLSVLVVLSLFALVYWMTREFDRTR